MKRREIYQRLWERLKNDGKADTAIFIEGKHQGERVIWKDGAVEASLGEYITTFGCQMNANGIVETEEGEELLVEHLTKQPKLVVLGGGHISKPICEMGKLLDFHVTVIDDRPEFANEERFSMADQVICCKYETFMEQVPFDANTYYVIVTRGHQGDLCCVKQLLAYPCAYLGMIGSKKKVAMTKEKLQEAGFSMDIIDTIYSPIGLKIGAQTPAEIAVSIWAEIIQVKNKTAMATIERPLGMALEALEEPAMLLTITDKKGSSPRGVGSRMLVKKSGEAIGSIGGGNAEYMAVQAAIRNLSLEYPEEIWQDVFDMTNRESANTGMICGGTIRVLFEYL